MFSKRNPMKYFSGNAFARLPLYKLVAGGSAVVLTASIGLGAFAAGVAPFNLPTATPAPVLHAPGPAGTYPGADGHRGGDPHPDPRTDGYARTG